MNIVLLENTPLDILYQKNVTCFLQVSVQPLAIRLCVSVLFIRHSPAIPHWEKEREAKCIVGPFCIGCQALTWSRCGRGDPPTTSLVWTVSWRCSTHRDTSGWCAQTLNIHTLRKLLLSNASRGKKYFNMRVCVWERAWKWNRSVSGSFLGYGAIIDKCCAIDQST